MTYDTDDIAVAAALRYFGYAITKIEIVGKRATFKFQDTAEGDAIKVQLGEKLVDAISFHREVRRLSGLVRSMVTRDE
jgi:hypothetical protein